jgi:regulator of replication initiation timing
VSGDETTHQKILAFLSGELSKKEERQCISIDLEHSPPGFRADLLKRWERTDHPEFFEELVFIEQMVAMMVEIAESDADSAGAGSGARSYTVRTRQQTGLRTTLKFKCAPSFESSDQALVVAGGNQPSPDSHSTQAMQIVSGNNRDLMRILQSQYRDTFGTLADLSAEMRDENVKLRAENIVLRRELEAATSTKDEKELENAIRFEKTQQSSLMTNKLLNIVTAGAAHVMGPKGGGDAPAPIMLLLGEFTKSLTKDQVMKVFGLMRQDQQVMLYSLMQMAVPDESKKQDEKKATEAAAAAP